MSLKLLNKYCDESELFQILDQLAQRILASHPPSPSLAMIGILKGGANVADYLAEAIFRRTERRIPVAYLDITLYRDDMITSAEDPYSRMSEIPFAVRKKDIILVDDVIFTGRTIRAALSNILNLGRPRIIRLATVVDRGFRELPIQPDFTGRRLETAGNQGVRVRMNRSSDQNGIFLYENQAK